MDDDELMTPLDLASVSASGHPSTPSLRALGEAHPSHPARLSTNASIQQSSGALSALSTILFNNASPAATPRLSTTIKPTLVQRRRLDNNNQVTFDLADDIHRLKKIGLKPRTWPVASAKSYQALTSQLKSSSSPSVKPNPRPENDDDDIPELLPPSSSKPTLRRRPQHKPEEAEEDEENLPPSPVRIPGAWQYDHSDSNTRAPLHLPPPFLQDPRSTKESFEGLLGTRSTKESLSRARQTARLIARDRPPPPPFPQSLLHSASKLFHALGPPGGLDSDQVSYKKWHDVQEGLKSPSASSSSAAALGLAEEEGDGSKGESEGGRRIPVPKSVRQGRRRLERAESGMKGFEVGERVVERVAGRLRRDLSHREEGERRRKLGEIKLENEDYLMERDKREDGEKKLEARATPMSFLLSSFDNDSASSNLGPPPLPPLIHQPLSFLPTLVESTSSSDSSNSLSTPISGPTLISLADLPPPKPTLAPLKIDIAEPSPFPTANPVPPMDGYFAPRRRRTEKEREKKATGPGSPAATQQPRTPRALNPSLPKSPHSPKSLSFPSNVFSLLLSHLQQHGDFVLWILLGPSDTAHISGLLGILLHLFGFFYFLLIHTFALVVSTYRTLRAFFYFGWWVYLNLSGKTQLGVVARRYWDLCRKEWESVSAEELESGEGENGLGVRDVVIGLAEMAAVQAMSSKRWLEASGLVRLLNGDDDSDGDVKDILDLGKVVVGENAEQGQEGPRPIIGRRQSTRLGRRRPTRTVTWTEDDGDGDSLLVTRGEGGVVEGEILSAQSPALMALSPSLSAMAMATGDLPPLHLDPFEDGFSLDQTPQHHSQSLSPPLRPLPTSSTETLLTLLKFLKRHVRLSTASYGLHSYIVAPPSPLFTPSGANLPHRIFSHLGNVGSENVLHVAIQKDYASVRGAGGVVGEKEEEEVYAPQVYILRDDVHGEVVCVIRGTQSLADIRTDLEASLGEVKLPSLHGGKCEDGAEKTDIYRAHAGFLAAARQLLDPETSTLFKKLHAALADHPGYSLVLTGHSLGAAIASSIALLIGKYTPASTSSSPTNPDSVCSKGRWTISSSSGLPEGRAVRAVCFAHPTTVDVPLSRRCALGQTPLVLSISLVGDVVTRMGVPQVRELRRALGRLARSRKQRGRSQILKMWWKWKSLRDGEDIDEEIREKIEDQAWKWRIEMDGDREGLDMMVPAGRNLHLDSLPRMLEQGRKREMEKMRALQRSDEQCDDDEDRDDDDDEEVRVVGLYEVRDPGVFYACPHIEADLVKYHLPKEYLDAIEAL
ncbi:hypothetical protein T439DRAFT_377514 [Meredithblackwellia eburnea MCA 4105]